MAIRIRTVEGVRVALCAVESDEEPGDVYLDDADDHALRAKLHQDWQLEHPHMRDPEWLMNVEYPLEWTVMLTQKRRDAFDEHAKWDLLCEPSSAQPSQARRR